MDHFGIILSLVTLVCFQSILAQRLKSLEQLPKVSSDFFLNKYKEGGFKDSLDPDAQLKFHQTNGTSNGILITSLALGSFRRAGNDFVNKQVLNPFFESLVYRPRNEQTIPRPPAMKTIYLRPGLRQNILSVFNIPIKNDDTEVTNFGSGMPSPGAEWHIENTRTSATPKQANPTIQEGLLSIDNTPINFIPVDQIPAYDNEVEQNWQSQTTINVKSSDPAPPTIAGVLSIEKLISKHEELFGLIVQYHTQVNNLMKDILTKLDAKGR